MLTAKQIEDAATALTCADPACQWCVDARAALAAYERVVAWAESGALAEVINSRQLPPEVRDAVKGCRDDVRRALEG